MPDPKVKKNTQDQNIDWEAFNKIVEEQNKQESLQQEDKPKSGVDIRKDLSAKTYSDAELAELQEKGISLDQAYSPKFNYDEVLSQSQSGLESFRRALGTGVVKGGLTFLENVGYLGDVENYAGLMDDMDNHETNWLSEMATSGKKKMDEMFPIHSGETADWGWWMQNLEGLTDSAVGFGATGGVAGYGIKSLVQGAKYLDAMKKMGVLTEGVIETLGTATATNYAESKMMASEMYNNIYNKAISEGVSADQAKEMAGQEAKEFIWKNKINIATDAVALRNMMSGRSLVAGNAQKTLGKTIAGFGKEAGAEAYEEVSSGFMQKEGERDAAQQLGIERKDDTSFISRASDYVTSEEGLREAMLGAIGGPIQTGAFKVTDKVMSKINPQNGPGSFNEVEPVAPGDLPAHPGEKPKTVEERLKEKYPNWDEVRIRERAKMATDLKTSYNEEMKDWEAKNKAYTDAISAQKKYEKDLDTYNARKSEHEKAVKEHETNNILEATGTRKQAYEDINNFLQNEEELQAKYQKAVMQDDQAAMKDLENQRFEGMFLRYAKRGAIDGLEMQLDEMSTSSKSTPEQKQKATEYREKLKGYEKEYLKALDKYGKTGYTEQVFKTYSRMKSTQESIGVINKNIAQAQNDLTQAVSNIDGTTISPTEQEYYALRSEQMELKKIEQSLRSKFNPKLAQEFDRKGKEYEARLSALEEELKSNSDLHYFIKDQAKADVYKKYDEFKKVEELAKDKAQAWAAYKAYENTYSFVTDPSFHDTNRKANLEYLNNQLDSAVSPRDLDVISRQKNTLDLSDKQRKDFDKKLQNKRILVVDEEKKLAEEYTKKREAYNTLKTRQDEVLEELVQQYNMKQSAEEMIKNLEGRSESLENIGKVNIGRANRNIRFLSEEKERIQELLESSTYDMSQYETLPKITPFIKKAEDITSNVANTIETTLTKENPSEEELNKSTKVTELKTSLSQLDKEGDIIYTESDPNSPIISQAAVEKHEEIKASYPFSIAYKSDSDGEGKVKLNITDWLETTPDVNKVGYKIRFEQDKEDSKFGDLNSVDTAPIRTVIYNSDGSKLNFNGQVHGWMFTVKPGMSAAEKKQLRDIRKKVLDAFKKGDTYETSVTLVGTGILHTDNVQKDPRIFTEKAEIVMSDGLQGLVNSKFKVDRKVDPRFENTITQAGFPFLVTKRPDGSYFPMRLNSRNLNETEANTLYDLFSDLVAGAKPSQNTEHANVHGISYKDAIDLLTFNGPTSVGKGRTLNYDFKTKTVQFGDTIIPFGELNNYKAVFVDYVKTMIRTTDSSLINKPLSTKFSNNFNWFGKDITIETEYNDFLFNDGALTSNAVSNNGRLFVNPYVKYDEKLTYVGAKPKTTAKKSSGKSGVPATDLKELFAPLTLSDLDDIDLSPIEPIDAKPGDAFKAPAITNVTPEEQEVVSKDLIEGSQKTDKDEPKKVTDDLDDIDSWEVKPGTIDKIKNAFDTDPDAKPSTYGGRTEIINVEKEIAWLSKVLPNVPSSVYKGLLTIPGGYAEGLFYNNSIILSDVANRGVAYHEAFHAVSRMYLTPDARQELYKEARKRWGKQSDNELEEIIAEEFRDYMIKKGELKVPSVFKWLYDQILNFINLFRDGKQALFANMRAGRFDYIAPFESSETLASSLKLPLQFQRTAVDIITYLTVKESGIMSLDRDTPNMKDLENTVFPEVRNMLIAYAKDAKEKGDLDKARNFREVVINFDSFKALVKDELLAYNLDVRKDDQDKSDDAKGDNSDRDYKNEGLNIKSALTFSGKENATGNTKLMISLLPSAEVDQYFGLPRFSDFGKTWKVLENNLSGLIDTGEKSQIDVMMNKVEELSKDHPQLKYLLNTLRNPNVPAYKKKQFFNAFSKQSIFYSNTFASIDNDGNYHWRTGNADVQNQANRSREDWLENFKYNFLSDDKVTNVQVLVGTIADFRKASEALAQRKDFNLEEAYKHFQGLLTRIGIETTEKGLRLFVSQHRGSTEAFKFKEAINRLSFALLAKNNKTVSLESMLSPQFKYEEGKDFISDNSVFLQLAKAEAEFSDVPGESGVIGPDGNMYYTKSQNNNMTKTVASWKSNSEKVTHLASKTYHKYSKWLKLLQDPETLNKFRVEIFLANKVEDEDDMGTTYSDLTGPDDAIDRMVRTLHLQNASFSPLTFADKSTWYLMSGIEPGRYKCTYRNGKFSTSDLAIGTVYNYILAELERISKAVDSPSDIQYYDARAKKLFWFPELNNGTDLAKEIGLYDAAGKPVITNDLQAKLKPYIDGILKDRFNTFTNKLKSLDLLNSDYSRIQGMDKAIMDHYVHENEEKGAKDVNTRAVHNIISDFVMNSIVANIEFTMMFTGDPAFYKDLPKRTPAVIAPGNDSLIMDKDIPSTFNIAILNDVEEKSRLYDQYKEIYTKAGLKNVDEILSPYAKNNQADAYAMITPTRFRNLMIGLGKWTNTHDKAFKRLITKEEVGEDEIKHLLEMAPLKGMHFELREEGDKMVPTYLKYAQAILWPSLVKGTNLEKILNKMEKDGVDELIFNSGVKVGAKDMSNVEDIFEGTASKLKIITLSNSNWKQQQDLPNKYNKKGEALVGSQVRKNIQANLAGKKIIYTPTSDQIVWLKKYYPELSLNKDFIPGEVFVKLINQVESELSNKGRQMLSQKWGIKEGIITNMEGVYKDLISKLKRDRASMNVIEQVERGAPFDSLFQFKEKLESELHAYVDKSTIKLKAQGGAFIQMSNMGFNPIKDMTHEKLDPTSVIWFKNVKELQGPRMENGKVKSAQVLLPYKVIQHIPGYKSMTAAELRSKINDDVLEGIVGYRIPNQGMSSIDTIEIVGILPPSSGDTMVTYTEVTGKTGSDFDIDKMFMMMPHTHYDEEIGKLERVSSEGNKIENLENRRLEMWNAILTSPDNFIELTSPLDAAFLKEDAYYLALLEDARKNPGIWSELKMTKEEFLSNPNKKGIAVKFYANRVLKGLEFASPEYQMEVRQRNIAGKMGVAQTANPLTHVALAQQAKLFLKRVLPVGFKTSDGWVDLSQAINEDEESITKTISAWLNAYVDNAKDPYIALINNNSYTANTVFLLLRAGVGTEWVNRFMSQPILRELSGEYFNSRSKILSSEPVSHTTINVKANGDVNSFTTISEKNYIVKTLEKLGYSSENFPLTSDGSFLTNFKKVAFLEDQLLNPTRDAQEKILLEFLKMRWAADKLNDAVLASKQDVNGAGGSAANNLASREKVRKVLEEGIIGNFEKIFDGMIGAYKRNSEDLSNKIFKGEFFSKTQGVENTILRINEMIGSKYADNLEMNKKIIQDIYTYMYSGFDVAKIDTEKLKKMFIGSTSMAHTVRAMKQMDAFKDNLLIKALSTKITSETSPSFITLASTKHKDRTQSDPLFLEWEKMLADDSEIIKGYTVRKFAEDLATYAFYASGFKKNINSFYDLIPGTYMNGEIPGTNISDTSINEYIRETLAQNVDIHENFIDQFFRHNMEDSKLVPSVSGRITLPKFFIEGKVVSKSEAIAIPSEKFPDKLNTSGDNFNIKPRRFIKIPAKLEFDYSGLGANKRAKEEKLKNILYKYVGYYNGNYVYETINPLGMREKGNVIVEYSQDQKDSIVNTKATGLTSELKKSMYLYKFDDIMGDVMPNLIGFTPITSGETIRFEGLDGYHFKVKSIKLQDKDLYMMFAIRESDGREFKVHDAGETKEDALQFGLEYLRSHDQRYIEQGLKTQC